MSLNHRIRKAKTKRTESLVSSIKQDLLGTELTQGQIAIKHDVSASTVSRILAELRTELDNEQIDKQTELNELVESVYFQQMDAGQLDHLHELADESDAKRVGE